MKSLWKAKGFEKQTSWKVMRFSRENEQKSDADMYINNVEFSACRTTQHTPQQHSTALHSTATQHSNTAQQHSTATQHSNTAQQHSTAQPFTRVCLEFLTTLTCRALYGKSQRHGQSCRFLALVFNLRPSKKQKMLFFLYSLYNPDTLEQFKT